MRVRVIASKPRQEGDADITELIGKEFPVVQIYADGVRIGIRNSNGAGGIGQFVYPDEYEVVEQKETPQPGTLQSL